ncbi:IS630 family transposase [Xenorhabdus sp. psl]|nr:IS630 family transposase [Xenorhabdus sp. psl]
MYVDESGFATDMPRCYGWSTKGHRCYGTQDWQAKGRINVIGALLNNRLLNVTLFEGNINSDIFYAWITEELLPVVPEGAVIVMDNASFHKREDIQIALRNAGKCAEYLPPYSPDLNPIEHKWAQAKARRRKQRCNVDALFSAPLF